MSPPVACKLKAVHGSRAGIDGSVPLVVMARLLTLMVRGTDIATSPSASTVLITIPEKVPWDVGVPVIITELVLLAASCKFGGRLPLATLQVDASGTPPVAFTTPL